MEPWVFQLYSHTGPHGETPHKTPYKWCLNSHEITININPRCRAAISLMEKNIPIASDFLPIFVEYYNNENDDWYVFHILFVCLPFLIVKSSFGWLTPIRIRLKSHSVIINGDFPPFSNENHFFLLIRLFSSWKKIRNQCPGPSKGCKGQLRSQMMLGAGAKHEAFDQPKMRDLRKNISKKNGIEDDFSEHWPIFQFHSFKFRINMN